MSSLPCHSVSNQRLRCIAGYRLGSTMNRVGQMWSVGSNSSVMTMATGMVIAFFVVKCLTTFLCAHACLFATARSPRAPDLIPAARSPNRSIDPRTESEGSVLKILRIQKENSVLTTICLMLTLSSFSHSLPCARGLCPRKQPLNL